LQQIKKITEIKGAYLTD